MVLQRSTNPTARRVYMTITAQRPDSVRESTYLSGLDGLRAIAVAAVIVYHFSPSALPAGFLGVDVFFVVSGFLIARLLVSEVARSGRVSLPNFWGRRSRRLLPALATMTVVVCLAASVKFSDAEIHDVRAHAFSTLFYCANWVINHGQGYFATVGRPSPFLHIWSLAVEEQFYVVLPLVVFFTRPMLVRWPVRCAFAALAGAVASTLWMAALVSPDGDPSRAYLGSDSHAMGLLVGVALGVLAGAGQPWAEWQERLRAHARAVQATTVLACAALAGIVLTMRLADAATYGLYRGGFFVFSLATGVVIAAIALVPATPLSRLLSIPWLVAVGLRSYSLYLWHWPVRVFIGPTFADGAMLFTVRLAVSVVLAEVSFRCVERPFRTGAVARRIGSRGAVAFYAALVITTSVLVFSVAKPKPLPRQDFSAFAIDPSLRRVDTFGDSTALVFGYNGALHARELGISVGGDADLGCGIVQAEHFNGDVVFANPARCNNWAERWRLKLADDPKAEVILMAGAWDLLDHRVAGARVRFGTPQWNELVTSAYHDALRVLSEGGHPVYVFEVPCYGPGDPVAPIPDRGSAERIAAVNAILARLSREVANVKVVHWRELVCPGGRRVENIDGVQLWEPDNVHLTEGGAVVVWRWWLARVPAPR
jgi:peptidoglycan/LPS O-acetylase OafA/YrhL